MLAIIISRHVGNYNFPKYWQIKITEMLAIILLQMLATTVSNCILYVVFENGDDFQQLNCSEMSAIICSRNGNMEMWFSENLEIWFSEQS